MRSLERLLCIELIQGATDSVSRVDARIEDYALSNLSQRGNWHAGPLGHAGPLPFSGSEPCPEGIDAARDSVHSRIIHIRLEKTSHIWIPISVKLFRMQIMLLRKVLAANIKKRMEERGWKQPDLAKHSTVGQSHISRIVNASVSAGLDRIGLIGAALGCQPWELLVDDDATRREALERMLGPRPSSPQLLAPPIMPTKRVALKRKPARK